MDLQTGLVYVSVVIVSAAVILLISMFAIKEKSYEEAIADQRKLPDDFLLGKKEKGKEKKHKNKTGKKVKEKKEDKEEKEEKTENPSVQFEETPVILPPEPLAPELGKGTKKKTKIEKVKPILINKDDLSAVSTELISPETPVPDVNHFDRIQPKDSLELIRSRSRERASLQQSAQSEPLINKSPKETPTKSKKNVKEPVKKKEEPKEEKKEVTVSVNAPHPVAKEQVEEVNEVPKEAVIVKASKESVVAAQSLIKESKKTKKKNDILAQIGGDRDGINVSLLMPLVQKAELSRSEIQILIDQLLNKQLDNPLEHSEWTEGRADPVIKLKKQLAEKEKALTEEHEASVTFQNKLKELRAELNSERSRLTTLVKQLEEALNAKVTEAQTSHTRMQHILESHAAEKQGFARQIEQLQTKLNDDAAIIHKMQEDQGQTQGHMQQELHAQRKQLEVQFAQMRDNENALKGQLAQKHAEVQELQNVNMNVTQELQATCESSTAQIDMLRQQLAMMQDQFMHSESQLQHFKEAGERMQDMARQLEESRRSHADLDHRLKNVHCHEQELQKQVHSLQAELKMAKSEANDSAALKSEFSKVQSELMKIKNDLSLSQNEVKSVAAENAILLTAMIDKEAELKYYQSEASKLATGLTDEKGEVTRIKTELTKAQEDLRLQRGENEDITEQLTKAIGDLAKLEVELPSATGSEKAEYEALQNGVKKASDVQLEMTRLREENDRLSALKFALSKLGELQKEVKQLREENESLASQLTATTERPSAEGRENGVEEKLQKNSVELSEHVNLLSQKENQLDALKVELTNKEEELNRLRAQVENLQSEVNNQNSLAKRLQDDLEAQRSKNNELRTKNWKVMEALSAAESRAKSNIGQSIDEDLAKVKVEEQESTKFLLQRIFPDVEVTEKSYDRWLKAFEEQVNVVLTELRNRGAASEANEDLEKQNKNLQGMVLHYKQIIEDTEGMLNKLQTHIETAESRWQSQLLQKENVISNLRIELKELHDESSVNEKLTSNEAHESLDSPVYDSDGVEFAFSCIEKSLPAITSELQEKISELESRLAEEETLREESKAEILSLRAANKSTVQESQSLDLVATEQLHEEKARLAQELQNEYNKRIKLDEEVAKLRSIIESRESSFVEGRNVVSQLQDEVTRLKSAVCGISSISDQSTINGPATSDSSKSEPTRPTESLIAAIEKTLLKNADPENCSVSNLVQSQQETDNSPLTSEIYSKICHTTEHNTQASWNPLNGQQHKKHKRKRKGGSGKK